jgi:tetratricopeptide (TPR) repeat protein
MERTPMTDRPLITMCLITKDEKDNVRRCFDSWWAFVDEVVVVDTGSKDGTLGECLRYAKRRREENKLKTKTVKWTDDFAAARQVADNLATGQWVTWCDGDDTITGMKELRRYADEASDDVVAFFTRYRYATDSDSNTISELWRERLVRNDGTPWTGRLHEHKLITRGPIVKVDPSIAEWVHHRDHEQRTGERNLRILEQWNEDEPNSARILHSLAMEYMGAERSKDASDMFARYLECPGEMPDRRAQACRLMCQMLMVQGRVEEARAHALQSLADLWNWADTHLTLAEAEQTLGRPDVALRHAQTAREIGMPDTLLVINPLQYTAHPLALQAVCLAQMGRFDAAVRLGEEALGIAASYQLVTAHLPLWRGQLKKQQTVATWMAAADVLVEAGELVKARAMLDQAPWYVVDNEHLIRKRVEIVRELNRRQDAGPEHAEDEAADAWLARHLDLAVAA